MPSSVIQRSFTAGELSPALAARADQAKYISGLRSCHNWIVLRSGGVSNRPGTKYVATVKDATHLPRLIKFVFEAADQSYLIECGGGYFRFYWHGAPVVVAGVAAWNGATAYVVGDLVVSGGVNYYCVQAHTNHIPPNATYWYALTGNIFEVPNPYAGADVAAINYTQSADTVTLFHPGYVPQQLQRLGHTTWRLVPFATVPGIDAPTGVVGVKGAVGTRTFKYIVSAAKAETFEESYGSAVATITLAATPTVDVPNTLSWNASAGAAEYYIYLDPYANGIFGFIGTAQTTNFSDVGFAPDFTITPPQVVTLFNAAGDYPSVGAYYQQRLFLARSTHKPETTWASKVGAYTNFSISTPLQDDDAVTFVLAGLQLSPVAFLIGLSKALVVLSDTGEWVIHGDQTGTITPTAINATQDGFIGASNSVPPTAIGNALLFAQARGAIIRELAFSLEQGGFVGADLTIFATHLFDGYTVKQMDFALQPFSVVWVIRSDGTLLGLTYVREQEVWGWHRHDTGANGQFQAVAVLPETASAEDVAYFVVQRTINGSAVRYIERLASRLVKTVATDAIFMDAALQYSGAPATTFGGLSHLEGQVVAVLGDGLVVFGGDPRAAEAATYTVTGGQITLPAPYSNVTIGLAIRFADLETLDLDVQGSAIRDKRKRVAALTAIVHDSARGFYAGPDADHLLQYRPESWEAAASMIDGALEINLTSAFRAGGRVVIRQVDPLPFTLLGVIPSVEVGG